VLRAGGLSFVTPLAYDWKYALKAVEAYYPVADEIILGLDKDRISWSGLAFEVPLKKLKAALARLDPQKKIRLVEGDFHSQGKATLNDTHERNQLSLACRPGNWIVQIDSDELVLNGPEFRSWLLARWGNWNVLGHWLTVYKAFPDAYLVVDKAESTITVATRRQNAFTGCRDTREWKRQSPLKMLHFSWGRSQKDLEQKLASWTHSADFDTARFLKVWRSVDLKNYRDLKNFHPMDGPDWPALRLVKRGNPEFIPLGI
jgi:hypothetical protein